MKRKLFYVFITFLSGITTQLYSQTDSGQMDSVQKVNVNKPLIAKEKHKQVNFIKLHLTGILLKNYQLQYERTLSKSISIAIAYKTMPVSTIPFKNKIVDIVGEGDPETTEIIESVRLGNTAITPEIRFYLSRKGYGRGFYIAPFYRHASFKMNELVFDYTTSTSSTTTPNKINLSGKLTSNTGGLLFGVQKALWKHMCLDLWFFGPHYGSGKGNFNGVSRKPLTPAEQAELKQQLDDLDIPLIDKTVTVTANGASVKLDGSWGGLRAGILIGLKF
ncbi:MAG: hypothetical protein WKF85_10290 [Chitinophagaceae bacterium]